MNRAEFSASLVVALIAPPKAAISATIEITRDASDLLTPFTVTIAVSNPLTHVVTVDFPTADIYRIDVERGDGGGAGGQTVWSSATGHKPLPIARRVDIAPGRTRLLSQIVDGTTDDRRAYAPGAYIVHVVLLGTTLSASVDRTIAFNPPLAIADARRATGGTVVTIAGVPQTSAGEVELRDGTGSIRLSRPLGLRPTGAYIVRGYFDTIGDDVQFAVSRFAPAFDNLSEGRPQPATSAAPVPPIQNVR